MNGLGTPQGLTNVGEEAKPPYAVLPDPFTLFLGRSKRLRALASGTRGEAPARPGYSQNLALRSYQRGESVRCAIVIRRRFHNKSSCGFSVLGPVFVHLLCGFGFSSRAG